MSADRTKFKIKSYKFKKKKHNDGPVYTRNLKVSDINKPERYVLFSTLRVGGYKNSYDFKFHTELSHFDHSLDFDEFIMGIGKWDYFWKKLISESRLANFHIKTDVNVLFDFFRKSLSYAYCKDPKIMINAETGKRSFYLTKNFYIYEKDQCVRVERRFVRAKDIYERLNVKTYADLIYGSGILNSPFRHLCFFSPNRLTKKISSRSMEVYFEFLQLIDSKAAELQSTKKGDVWVRRNTFINAKLTTNQRHKGAFSKEIQPHMENIKFSLCTYFNTQKDIFFKKEIAMSDEQKKTRNLVRRKDENTIEVLPPEPSLVNEKSFKDFSLGYDKDSYNQQELTMIYLRGYLNMAYDEVAKTLKISKDKARQLGKDLEKEVANVRIERSIEIRKNCGATKQHIETAKSLLVGKAIQALECKLSNANQSLIDLPIEKLIKIISDFSPGLEVNSTIFTGRTSPLIGDLLEAEKLIEEY